MIVAGIKSRRARWAGAWVGLVLIVGGLFFLVAHFKDSRQLKDSRQSHPVEPTVTSELSKGDVVEVPAE